MAHFLTVRFPGKHRNEYGDPAAFFKVNDPTAGQTLLTLFREDHGAALPKGPGLLFDLVDAAGLTPAQAVRFEASVRQVKETWEGAYSVTDGPQFSGNLDRLYDRADKWQDAADAAAPGKAANCFKQALEQLRELAVKKSGVGAAIVLSLVLITIFEVAVYELPWAWLRDHTNSYGIQAEADLAVIVLMLGLFMPSLRKILWFEVGLAVVVALTTILGGSHSADTTVLPTPSTSTTAAPVP
jgi:hypothetical protein